MTKKELLEKVKFMEKALEQNEELSLVGIRTVEKVEYLLANTKLIELLYDKLYVVLNAEQLNNKKSDLNYMETKYCKCEIFDFENECNCNIPSKEELEKEWYENILNNIHKRAEEIFA